MDTTPPNLPQAPQSPPPLLHASGYQKTEIDQAMWCHLIPVIASAMGMGLLAFIGPLVIMQTNAGKSAYVTQHAKESLNFQISILLYVVALVILTIIIAVVTLGFGMLLMIPLLIGIGIGTLVMEIIATIKATQGQHFDYMVAIRFIK